MGERRDDGGCARRVCVSRAPHVVWPARERALKNVKYFAAGYTRSIFFAAKNPPLSHTHTHTRPAPPRSPPPVVAFYSMACFEYVGAPLPSTHSSPAQPPIKKGKKEKKERKNTPPPARTRSCSLSLLSVSRRKKNTPSRPTHTPPPFPPHSHAFVSPCPPPPFFCFTSPWA